MHLSWQRADQQVSACFSCCYCVCVFVLVCFFISTSDYTMDRAPEKFVNDPKRPPANNHRRRTPRSRIGHHAARHPIRCCGQPRGLPTTPSSGVVKKTIVPPPRLPTASGASTPFPVTSPPVPTIGAPLGTG